MATPPTDASRLLAGKISVPSDMRTREWLLVPQWIRERSFFMAGVARAEILQEFRSEIEAVAAGRSGEIEALGRLQRFLDAAAYQPLPGQEGTIKDLRLPRRVLTSIRTNVSLLQGWAQKERGSRPGPMRAFPAFELKRVRARMVPRVDWDQVWLEQGGQLYGGRRIALKTSDIWAAIGNAYPDSMGVDYPPLRWGSGLGWRDVPRKEAKALGIPLTADIPAERPVRSPNESLELSPKVSEPALREALEDRMQGLAEWQGEKFVFTDPNGTRPLTAEQLAAVWKRPLPSDFTDLPGGGQMQRESFLDWVADSGQFHNDPARGENKDGRLDWWEDFQRVLLRLEPDGRERDPLFRALSWNNNRKFSEFLDGVIRDGYSPRPTSPAESWTASMQSARKYAAGGKYQVILKLPSGHSAGRDIAPLVRAFEDEVRRREIPAGKHAVTDDEIILPSWAGVRVKKIGEVKETSRGKVVEIELEEVR